MTSPEQGKRIVVTEADLLEEQVEVTHQLPSVDVNRQLPAITTEQELAGITLRDPEA